MDRSFQLQLKKQKKDFHRFCKTLSSFSSQKMQKALTLMNGDGLQLLENA